MSRHDPSVSLRQSWFAISTEHMKAKLQRRTRKHGRTTEEEVRDILSVAVNDEGAPRGPLGSRFKARFVHIGLDRDIEELRGQIARPAGRG